MVTFDGASLVNLVAELQDRKQYQELNWNGTFGDYLELVTRNPRITRTAFQRVYDMVMAYGAEEFVDAKKRLIRYNFFSDPSIDTADAIYGLEVPLMRLVSFSALRGRRLRHRTARSAATRTRRFVEIDDCAPPQKRSRTLLTHSTTVRCTHLDGISATRPRYRAIPMT